MFIFRLRKMGVYVASLLHINLMMYDSPEQSSISYT